ncbi:MAG: lamin tail domain-containing protein [Phycisphaerales bacterium]
MTERTETVSRAVLALAALAGASAVAAADIRITEYMYSGNDGEFVEFTNLGGAAVDLSGWSFDDSSREPGVFALSGMLGAGQSMVITESEAEFFRSAWGLSAEVLILGGVENNLGRNDEINLYNAMGGLVDRLTYGDGDFPGTFRTQEVSANPGSFGDLGANDIFAWQASEEGDSYGSYFSAGGDLGNPGAYVPAPGAIALLGLGGLMGARRRR